MASEEIELTVSLAPRAQLQLDATTSVRVQTVAITPHLQIEAREAAL